MQVWPWLTLCIQEYWKEIREKKDNWLWQKCREGQAEVKDHLALEREREREQGERRDTGRARKWEQIHLFIQQWFECLLCVRYCSDTGILWCQDNSLLSWKLLFQQEGRPWLWTAVWALVLVLWPLNFLSWVSDSSHLFLVMTPLSSEIMC